MPAPPNNPSDAALETHSTNGLVSPTPVPSHLYDLLPAYSMLPTNPPTPDYLKLITLSKVYSSPLNMTPTPLTKAVNLSKKFGCEIWLKREDQQEVFSFKIRGAFNLMSYLGEEERWKGVVTCSAGNHAQGVALAGFKLGIPATIVMPLATPSIKWLNVERLGAKVVLFGDDFDQAKAECARLAKQHGLFYVPPYDHPLVIAGQGTIALELMQQLKNPESLDGIFASIGGGGLVSGINTFVRRVCPPSVNVYGVETFDGDAMKRSLDKGERVTLDEVGAFPDGTAVKIVGEEPFRLCKDEGLAGIELCDNDEICAAIKDVFEETRTVPEPSGALALAGLKSHILKNNLKGSGKRFVAVVSGANVNFGKMRFVAERAELGERREVLMSITIPEVPGSFRNFHNLIHPRTVTEFSYRYAQSGGDALIFTSFLIVSKGASGPTPSERATEVNEILSNLKKNGMTANDVSDDEISKDHIRYLIGGRVEVENERVFRFEFPERPNALHKFLHNLDSCRNNQPWNISMFHYRNHGADLGKVLIGIQVAPEDSEAFDVFLKELGYSYTEQTDNAVYKRFLRVSPLTH